MIKTYNYLDTCYLNNFISESVSQRNEQCLQYAINNLHWKDNTYELNTIRKSK